MSDGRIAVRIRITGRVQGVGYRAWACREAEALGVDGWVRNRTDRSVEALIAGPADSVAAMVERCRCGPSFSRVSDVVEAADSDPGRVGFVQHPTG